MRLSTTSPKHREMQTRIYATKDEIFILSACADLMLDMGYNLNEIESELGVITGSKTRFNRNLSFERPFELISCCITTYPLDDSHTVVRVTFSRTACWGSTQDIKGDNIKIPAVYVEFFARLSKAVFLEGQKL